MNEPNANIDPLPGCTGECKQCKRPCLHPEECFPEGIGWKFACFAALLLVWSFLSIVAFAMFAS